jgi:hypothetical protein
MTTIPTTQHQRIPLWVTLAVAGAFVVGGAIGFTWDQDNTTGAVTQSQSSTSHDALGGTTAESGSISGSSPVTPKIIFGAPDAVTHSRPGSVPGTGSPGGATTPESTR